MPSSLYLNPPNQLVPLGGEETSKILYLTYSTVAATTRKHKYSRVISLALYRSIFDLKYESTPLRFSGDVFRLLQ